jgi:hypothetical protein
MGGEQSVFFGPQCLIEAADAKLLEPGEECTLLDWGNAVVTEIDHNARLIKVRRRLEEKFVVVS